MISGITPIDYETIRERYLKGYITDEQLARFRDLGMITQEQYEQLYNEKHPYDVN